MGKRGGDLLEDQSYCPNHSETVSMAIANATTDANDQLIDKMDSLTLEHDIAVMEELRGTKSYFSLSFFSNTFLCLFFKSAIFLLHRYFMKNDLIEAQKLRLLADAACFLKKCIILREIQKTLKKSYSENK